MMKRSGFALIGVLVALTVAVVLAIGGYVVWMQSGGTTQSESSPTPTSINSAKPTAVSAGSLIKLTPANSAVNTEGKIAFVRDGDIWLINADGSGEEKIVDKSTGYSDNNVENLQFSASGKYLIWETGLPVEGQDYSETYTLKMNLPTRQVERLMRGGFYALHPFKDELIAGVTDKDNLSGVLKTVDLATGEVSVLWRNFDLKPKSEPQGRFGKFQFSPDATMILTQQVCCKAHAPYDVAILDLQGNLLHHYPQMLPSPYVVKWLPNSAGIIFERDHDLLVQYLSAETPTAVVQDTGRYPKTLTPPSFDVSRVNLKVLVVMSPTPPRKPVVRNVYLVNLDGTQLERLTAFSQSDENGNVSYAGWVTEGKVWFVNTVLTDGTSLSERKDLWLMDQKGANVRKVAEGIHELSIAPDSF